MFQLTAVPGPRENRSLGRGGTDTAVPAPHVQRRADPLLFGSLPERMMPERMMPEGMMPEGMIRDWAKFLSDPTDEKERELLHRHQRTGRPLGGQRFITKLEEILARKLPPQKNRPSPNP